MKVNTTTTRKIKRKKKTRKDSIHTIEYKIELVRNTIDKNYVHMQYYSWRGKGKIKKRQTKRKRKNLRHKKRNNDTSQNTLQCNALQQM